MPQLLYPQKDLQKPLLKLLIPKSCHPISKWQPLQMCIYIYKYIFVYTVKLMSSLIHRPDSISSPFLHSLAKDKNKSLKKHFDSMKWWPNRQGCTTTRTRGPARSCCRDLPRPCRRVHRHGCGHRLRPQRRGAPIYRSPFQRKTDGEIGSTNAGNWIWISPDQQIISSFAAYLHS